MEWQPRTSPPCGSEPPLAAAIALPKLRYRSRAAEIALSSEKFLL